MIDKGYQGAETKVKCVTLSCEMRLIKNGFSILIRSLKMIVSFGFIYINFYALLQS